MKHCAERFIYVILLLFACTTAFAQPYKKLAVNDFRGIPNSGYGDAIAFTSCSIDFRFVARRDGDHYILTFTIKLDMNHDQSWVDRNKITTPEKMAEILTHEQGHYNIAYMEQQELLRTVAHTVFHDNYTQEANDLFDRIDAKYKQLNIDYDADTQNSTNRVQQHSWNVYFDRKLAYMPRT